MRVNRSWLVLLVCVSASLCLPSAHAKGRTTRLVVEGPTLAAPVEIIEERALSANVWSGDFAETEKGAAPKPVAGPDPYRISFYVVPPRATKARLAYVVYFVWDPSTQRGFVYFPGPGEKPYSLNASSILRPHTDSNWYPAAPEWAAAVKAHLP